ncbi:hypothetical protein ACIBCT_08805 [Streptosporangium sp. NPDC050855]|uniref:hypothetical protein n=1 Tax=Streptosporangium sp. NPDC050855 TaxID=3366194 RepID=UPI0037A00547
MSEGPVAVAARNNAEWCDLVCRGHGLPGEFGPGFWVNRRHRLAYYPSLVTLSPQTSAEDVLRALGAPVPGTGVKDSFATLDLGPAGYEPLFEATWIHRPAGRDRPAGGPLSWQEVTSAEELDAWRSACADEAADVFLPSLLESPECRVVAGRVRGRVVAGAMVNLSERAVGVSNVFCGERDPDEVWSGLLDAAARIAPDRPVVGYERDDALRAAIHNGCRPIGPLRVWVLPAGG